MAKTPVKTEGNGASVSTPAADEKKRQASKSLYVNAAGETTRSPTKDSVIVRFVFDGITEPVDLDLNDLNDEIRHLGLCQGINIKLQRSYNTAKGNAAEMKETCEETRDNLIEGVWTGDREGGFRIGDLAQAIMAALKDDGDTNVNDERLASIKAKLSASGDDGEKAREMAKKSVKVSAHLARIQAEKAQAKAAAAATSAATATEHGLTGF